MLTAKQWTSLTTLYFDVPETGIETSITAAPPLGNQWWGKGRGVVQGWVDLEAGTKAKGVGTQSSRLQEGNEWNLLTTKPVSCPACHTRCWHVSAARIAKHQVPGNKNKYKIIFVDSIHTEYNKLLLWIMKTDYHLAVPKNLKVRLWTLPFASWSSYSLALHLCCLQHGSVVTDSLDEIRTMAITEEISPQHHTLNRPGIGHSFIQATSMCLNSILTNSCVGAMESNENHFFTKVSLVEEETLGMTSFTMMQIEVGALMLIQSSYYRKAIDVGQGKRDGLPERCVMCKLKLGRHICG